MATEEFLSISEKIDDEIIEVSITDSHNNFRRLDQLLSSQIAKLSRNSIQKLFELGLITDEQGNELKQNRMPPFGTKVFISIPPPQDYNLEAKNIPLEILFEDDDLIFLNKQQGLVVHPAPGNWKDTLVNALLFHCPNLPGIGHTKRPGIVHRLDKGTSGVMVVAKSSLCHERLVNLFKQHALIRKYECLVIGTLPPKFTKSGKIETKIGRSPLDRKKMTTLCREGKISITDYTLLNSKNQFFHHFECQLHTGRTHQIRVHMSEIIKTPILGDSTYGNCKKQADLFTKLKVESHAWFSNEHPYLHAKYLELVHPMTGKNLSFQTKPPEIWNAPISYLYS